jgi:hypothetical protein
LHRDAGLLLQAGRPAAEIVEEFLKPGAKFAPKRQALAAKKK